MRCTKETVVGIVKLGDAHLRTLEQRIALHEERLVQSHARGDTSAVVQNTDTLRQLYMEHKGKLDDMLFFWIFGGSVCIAGWVRAAWVYNHREQDIHEVEADLRVALVGTVREAVAEQFAVRLGEASDGAPAEGAAAAAAPPDESRQRTEDTKGEAADLKQDMEKLARVLQLTMVASFAGCALSLVSLATELLVRR